MLEEGMVNATQVRLLHVVFDAKTNAHIVDS
jgi:hypothetical protein